MTSLVRGRRVRREMPRLKGDLRQRTGLKDVLMNIYRAPREVAMSTRTLGTRFAFALLACGLSIPSFADSQARIVRLSQVDGDVQIDRAVGRGYEKAFINLPI